MNVLSQLFGGMTQVWLNVAFIVCVFAVLTFRPEQIRNVRLFGTACGLFALSLIVPSVGMFVVSTVSSTPAGMGSRAAFGEITLSMKIVNLIGPLFFAMAFLAAANSLIPTAGTKTVAARDDQETSASSSEPPTP
jgi:TRAP-type C4-dicarboxylate transport system permease small subunit